MQVSGLIPKRRAEWAWMPGRARALSEGCSPHPGPFRPRLMLEARLSRHALQLNLRRSGVSQVV